MNEIVLENIRIYAFHGCMKEEARIGSDYIVNLNVKADLENASISDQLEDTINYVDLLKIVNEEMAINSKLLEHVAGRIVSRILRTMKMVNKMDYILFGTRMVKRNLRLFLKMVRGGQKLIGIKMDKNYLNGVP